MFSTQDIKVEYRRQAKRYDFAVQLYRLLGLRIKAYRLRASNSYVLNAEIVSLISGAGPG